MSRSNLHEAPLRPKIFGQWPKKLTTIPSSFIQQPRKKDKHNQSLRAEEALRKSSMIMVNIRSFLKQKQQIQIKCIKFNVISQQCKLQLQKLSRQSGRPFDGNKFEQALRNYYLHIRNQSKYLPQVQSFLLSNLQNYDSRVTAPKFTRLPGEAYKQLHNKLNDLQQKRMRLQQTLTMYQQNIEPSQILQSQFNFQTCLQNLLKQISQQRLQQIHYLMLYQLQQVTANQNNFKGNIQNDRASYAIFQAINDSLNLMVNQREQMKKDRRLVEKAYVDLRMDNAQFVIPSSSDSLPILLKNEKVYDTNKQLLARYNAQTNLVQYANRRKLYIEQLTKYKSKLAKWKQQQQISSFLYNRHQILNRFIRRLSLGENNNTLKSQREDVKKSYYDCLNLQIPQNMHSIRKYKMELIADLGDTLQKQGIILSQRNQLIGSTEMTSSLLAHREQNKFHKYLNFFIELERIPDNKKISYLVDNKQTVIGLKYQLSHNPSPSAKYYKIDLDYCESMIAHQQNNQHHAYINRIQTNRKIRWVGLPIGLDSLLFYYTNDAFLKMQANNYINQTLKPKIQQLASLVQEDIKKDKLQTQLSRQKQYPYKYFTLKPQQRRFFYFSLHRKISVFSPQMKKTLQNKYWDTIQQIILKPYVAATNQKKLQVQKKYFFTFRTLSYIKKQGSSIKLSNFQQLIHYYIEYIQKYSLFKWDQTDLFMQIIKQRIFIKYLKDKLTNKLDVEIQLQIMQKINKACVLLYQSNDHIKLLNSNDLQVHLQYGIKLHTAWQQLITSLNINVNKKIQIQEKCRQFLNGIKKSPIILGTKATLSEIQLMLNLNSRIDKLKLINGLIGNITFLSAVYIRCHNLLNVIQNLQYPFAHSDVLMPRQANDKVLYLQKVQQNCKKQLNAIKPYLIKIIGIYKGKQIERQQSFNNKYGTQIQKILGQIIVKLNSIRA